MERFVWVAGTSVAAPGTTRAVSPDGATRVTVLGSGNAQGQAEKLLQLCIGSDSPVHASQMPVVGYVLEIPAKGLVRVVASPVGQRQIYWSSANGQLRLATEPGPIAPPRTGRGSLSPDALFHYVYFHCLPGPDCAFEGVSKLDGGHQLDWDGCTAQQIRYWRPSLAPDSALTLEAASGQLHKLLGSAVERAMSSAGQCGAFLSGGLDSSTVAGFAARARPGIPTVSMGFDADGFDEMTYARIASKHFGTRALEYYVTPEDVVRSLPDIAAAFAEPFGNSSAAAAFHCARIAREEGLDTLLAGDGGDEIFGGNDRYATQLIFERYSGVPGVARAILEPSIRMASSVIRMRLFERARSYIRQANTPLPDRLQEYNFLHRIAPSEVFAGDLLAGIHADRPLQLLREEYQTPTEADAVGRMLFMDWKFTLHDNDLVKVNTMCELAGVKVAYPMLDPALIEFSMRIPSTWKVRNGQLRWFYKRAMRDFLPREIIEKTKHGFGLPFGAWTRTHAGLQRMSADALDSLAKRRYFRPEFIAQAQRLHREGHASYYGELVWILMTLELWLQRHMPRAGL